MRYDPQSDTLSKGGNAEMARTNQQTATNETDANYSLTNHAAQTKGTNMQTAEELAAAFVDNETEESATEKSINDENGNVSVTDADKAKAKSDEDAKKQLAFTLGPKFQTALDEALFNFNKQLEEQSKSPVKMSAYLRNIVARSIGFDLSLDPVKTRSKYATDEERKAALKASQAKAAEERKQFNKLIKMANDKSTRAEAIRALMESLGIDDDDVDE